MWLYRLHQPKIELAFGVRETLNILKNLKSKVVILTDSRSITQRLKVNAGLDDLPLYISEIMNLKNLIKKDFYKLNMIIQI